MSPRHKEKTKLKQDFSRGGERLKRGTERNREPHLLGEGWQLVEMA